MSFNYKKFLKEGGIEKYLLEEQFGNDIESRYNFIRPLMSRLPDSARTEAMIDGMEEAKAEDDKQAFDFYFVETMKMLGLEDELMEPGDDEPITPPGPEDMPGAKVSPFVTDKELANIFVREGEEDELTENDDVLDEMLDEAKFEVGDMVVFFDDQLKGAPMKVVGMRKMFTGPRVSNVRPELQDLHAVTVEKPDGETAEYDESQLAKLKEVEGEVNEIFGFGKSVKYVDGGPDKYGLPPTLKSGAKEVNGTPEFEKTRMAKKIEQIVSDTKDQVKAKGKAEGSSAYGTPGKLRALVTKTIAGPGDKKFGEFNEEDSFFVHLTDKGGNTQIFFNFLEQAFKKDPEITASLQMPDMFPEKDSITLSLKADKVLSEEVEGEVQTENKVLKASNDLEDAINSVADELTDAQIDSITDMILDLRDKVKAKKK